MPTHSNSSGAASWPLVQGIVWSALSVGILSGWFVVTRLGFRHDLRVWDVIALRFGEGAALLTPLVGPRAAAAIIALVPVTTTLLAIPVLGEWPSWSSSAVICLVALGVVFAAVSASQSNLKGESL